MITVMNLSDTSPNACPPVHHETVTGGTTRVQTHETDPGVAPGRLGAPGMHRVACGDLLANAVEDCGGGGALWPPR